MEDRGLRILLVDDDEDDYVMTRDLLSEIEGKRFDLDWVATYDDALEAMGRNEHDVYLVDYRLGERDGLELLREALGNGCRAPMILLTGQGDHDVDVEAMKIGAADYLTKDQTGTPLLERSIRYAIRRTEMLEALRESQRFLQSTLDALATYIAILDASGTIIAVNAAWRRFREGDPLIGASHDVGMNYLEICESVRNGVEKAGEIATGIREVIANQRDVFYLEHPYDSPEEKRWFIVRVTRFNNMGSIRVVVAHEDITELKRTQEALLQSEEQLRQSQKMEAIGKLAGGVAHDFNNLLVPMMGYGEMLLNLLGDRDPLRRYTEQIKKAADRAASLTRQLLVFSRKQVLQPQVLDLNTVVADLNKMLRRLIGEDIELVVLPDPAVGRVKADPGQIEQVIVNLVVNARDAMPQGGKLIVETANVELDEAHARRHVAVQSGAYAMLAVSDTGCGMDEETRSHIFEPFFTTKEEGKGTGLGLSTVYGIVRQSGGNIWVYSELEKGSTFKIYLPRIEEAITSFQPEAADTSLPQGSEIVLVVEDAQEVRTLICETLENDGYRTLEAHDGGDALLVSKQHEGPIHLMVTDVVMPGMGGRELSERLTSLRPEMKVLYMSGYTDNTVVQHGVLDPGLAFLQKPFARGVLAHKVREVLDAPQQG